MAEEPKTIDVFLDLEPNVPKNEQTRESFRQRLRHELEQRLEAAVERIWKLPPIFLKGPREEYVSLLLEARGLFVDGRFYSCVAMCGIVSEKLAKDAFRSAVLVSKDNTIVRPSETAFDQFERVETNGIVRFLKETGLLSPTAAKAADELAQLRNKYAHARGKNPEADAVKAINLLHELVEGTVSMFKDFQIKHGVFVPKSSESAPRGEG